nr:MAG TPA: hypothetical protein [Caudoviricetes sp.]DAR36996.1 MAG TPA: hypothetical protein [Caudoviricetes sp.]DAU88355.1 MAG TPA: hypothetical protein [Caudoviricetes sp.]DAW74530.1 MAG TPA: hypothetical protein [Caudoviricetes sp.]DAZ43648.1 MAG TPA: hypothetical protein [Caudoviricetes sp.]
MSQIIILILAYKIRVLFNHIIHLKNNSSHTISDFI